MTKKRGLFARVFVGILGAAGTVHANPERDGGLKIGDEIDVDCEGDECEPSDVGCARGLDADCTSDVCVDDACRKSAPGTLSPVQTRTYRLPRRHPGRRQVAAREMESYAVPLAIGYLIAPLVAVPVGAKAPLLGFAVVGLIPATFHWGYGEAGSGALALFAAPTMAAFGGWAALGFKGSCGKFDCVGTAIAGALVGYVLWASVDVALNSSREVPPSRVALTPSLAHIPGGAAVGLAGAF